MFILMRLTDINDRGGVIMRLMRKFSPGQKRLHFYEASGVSKVKRKSIGHHEAVLILINRLERTLLETCIRISLGGLELKTSSTLGLSRIVVYFALN